MAMYDQRFGLTGVLLVCLLSMATANERFTMVLSEEAIVHGPEITIGDVAEIHGPGAQAVAQLQAIVIGQSPPAGEVRFLHSSYISTRLKQHGFDPQQWTLSGPDRLRVIRAFQRLEARDIEAVVRQTIRQKMPWEPQRATIVDIRGIEAVVVPPGTVQYEVIFRGRTDFLGPTSFSLLIQVDGNIEKRLHGTAYIEVSRDVVIVTRPLAKHEVITDADIRLQSMKFTRFPRQLMSEVAEVIGKRTKRPLRANAMLHAYEIESQPLIRRGDAVLIVVESGRLKVSTMGEALEHGEQGETIRVKNVVSQREVLAVVTDSKTVRVPF